MERKSKACFFVLLACWVEIDVAIHRSTPSFLVNSAFRLDVLELASRAGGLDAVPSPSTMSRKDHNSASLEDLRKLAELLDSKFKLPFGIRVGWDGILGLIPGVGDLFTSLVSVFILYSSYRQGCPLSVLLRMGLNIIIDNILSAVPILGIIFDIAWKSNLRNYELAVKFSKNPGEVTQRSRGILVLVILLCLILIAGLVTLTILFAKWILNFLASFS